MIRREHIADCPQEYLSAFGLNPDRAIYFDIETTGFRASTSSLYLIGWAVRADPDRADSVPDKTFTGRGADQTESSSGSKWLVTQILSESSREEALLLSEFSKVLKAFDTLVEFNGDRFDLPYMKEKYERCNLEDPFAHMNTVDLYREIRPLQRALGLPRLNQKSVEQFLSINRQDPYSGGELIDVYRSFRDHRCRNIPEALDALFLHNLEDVLGMLELTRLLSYRLALTSAAPVFAKVSGSLLEASFPLTVSLPKPLQLVCGPCRVNASCRTVRLSVQMLSGCLYHYFPDYRNYDYLPEEDMAIHKSVSSFVDRSHKKRATAQTCYVKKEGVFLPFAGGSETAGPFGPLFRRFYKDPLSWFEYLPGMEQDPDFSSYLHSLFCAAVSEPYAHTDLEQSSGSDRGHNNDTGAMHQEL